MGILWILLILSNRAISQAHVLARMSGVLGASVVNFRLLPTFVMHTRPQYWACLADEGDHAFGVASQLGAVQGLAPGCL